MKTMKTVNAKFTPAQPKDPRRDGFATAEEAARFIGVSRAMITKMTSDGRIPHKRFGRALRVPWGWLLDQVEQTASNGVRTAAPHTAACGK